MYQRKKSEADWALEILSQKQEPVFYAELTQEIAKRMGKQTDTATLTSIYTRINLDNRLIYQGDGYWYFDASKIYREV
ncbi:MAG: DNA-directed RNA polymerase subunit delta [Syntrophomonadaceae bacterium]|nr:DNA-directed RNA polymerase subunit delta [Syntrophomonadaceae bacterium]